MHLFMQSEKVVHQEEIDTSKDSRFQCYQEQGFFMTPSISFVYLIYVTSMELPSTLIYYFYTNN